MRIRIRSYLHMLAISKLAAYADIARCIEAGSFHMSETIGSRPESRCHCTALRKASRRISQLYDAALAESGLKTTQRAILAQIERSEPTTVGALAEALVMDAGGLAHTLKPLGRDGLIKISADPQDRRTRRIRLTPAGRAKLEETDVLWEAAQRSFEKGFGAARAKALREAMQLLVSDRFVQDFEAVLGARG
jgi:DNA-binding MarR family transcriptional regulator